MHTWLAAIARSHFPEATSWQALHLPDSLREAWDLLCGLCNITPATLAAYVAKHYALPEAEWSLLDQEAPLLVPEKMAVRYGMVPICADQDTITIAVSDPNDAELAAQIRFCTGRRLRVTIASPDDIEIRALQQYGTNTDTSSAFTESLDADAAESDIESTTSSIVSLGRMLIRRAIERRASDIHLHPFAGGGIVRYRIDGTLQRVATITGPTLNALIRFFKFNGKMDPTNALVPQDGRVSLTLDGRLYDLRVSTLPASGSESLVIRILDQSRLFSLDNTNFSAATRAAFRRVTQATQGLFLLTGPTGSGKTSTLYSILGALNTPDRRVITVEEPVEYRIHGLTQVDINTRAGLTFAESLRAILRQDPDVLLVGEIRDEATAEVAINAALTGHLVFSTLHTMDALRAIPRLIELGVRPAALADTLLGVASQRLLRQLCPHCRVRATEPFLPLEQLFLQLTDEPVLNRACGCPKCNFTGYLGRMPIAEVIEMDDPLRTALINHQTDFLSLQRTLSPHWDSISMRALGRIVSGDTTAEEAYAVLGMTFWNDLARRLGRTLPIQETLTQATQRANEQYVSTIVVSRDKPVALAVSALLNSSGFESMIEAEPHEARRLIERSPGVQLLILDLRQPQGDQLSFIRELRASLAWSGLPVIVLMDENDKKMARAMSDHGVADIVTFPLQERQLVDRVRAVLSR